jgi:GNAT superfamily N-acetyltransferase
MYQIKLIPKDKLEVIFPLLQLLNEKTEEAILLDRLNEMRETNYECVGVYDDDKLIGISGLWMLNKIYVGKHIEPDNVIILPEYRSKGIGEMMMQWIYEYAISKGCVASELNCYVSNAKGIRFWITQGYRILGFHMQRTL